MPISSHLVLLSCLLLGLRHGFDYDHLAAITDITSVQRGWRESMRLGVLYALGHALTVAVLGSGVVRFRMSLPLGLDALSERLVGATLVALAAYVVWTMLRSLQKRGEENPSHRHVNRSRIALLISGVRYAWWRVCTLAGVRKPRPVPFAFMYDRRSVFALGVVHGLGAETPSQLLLLFLAANLAGTSRALLALGCFAVGLVMMNTVMTACASGVFAGTAHRPRLQFTVTSLTAVYSFVVGAIFLFGASNKLPALVR